MKLSSFSARGAGDSSILDGAAFAAEVAAINVQIEAAADGWLFLGPGSEQRQCPILRPADSTANSAAATNAIDEQRASPGECQLITRGVEQGQCLIKFTSESSAAPKAPASARSSFIATLTSSTITAAVTNAAASDRASVAFAVSTAALSSFFRSRNVLTKEDGDATLAAISAAITAAISHSAAAVSAPADEDLDENEDWEEDEEGE